MSSTYPGYPDVLPPAAPPPVVSSDAPPDVAPLAEGEAPPDEFAVIDRRILFGDDPPVGIEALAAAFGVAYTVTIPNPTPPTNISYVAQGGPPVAAAATNEAAGGDAHNLRNGATPYIVYSADAALFAAAGTPGSLTAIATPLAGGSGPASESTGLVTVVTAPGSVATAPTQSVSTGSSTLTASYTTTPNATHPSAIAPTTPPTITSFVPASPVGNGGSTSLVVNGTGFQPSSIVVIGGVAYNTQYNSSTQLMVLNAPKRTSAGNTPVTVSTNGTAITAVNWVFS